MRPNYDDIDKFSDEDNKENKNNKVDINISKKIKLIGAISSYICMAICLLNGFNKMFIYKNSESIYIETKNAYVGGDAYNYIINSGFATAWFVLAGVCAILGFTFIVAYYLDGKNL